MNWVKFLTSLIQAIENGEVAADAIKGKTLEEIVELSEAGWDKFDEALEEARNTP